MTKNFLPGCRAGLILFVGLCLTGCAVISDQPSQVHAYKGDGKIELVYAGLIEPGYRLSFADFDPNQDHDQRWVIRYLPKSKQTSAFLGLELGKPRITPDDFWRARLTSTATYTLRLVAQGRVIWEATSSISDTPLGHGAREPVCFTSVSLPQSILRQAGDEFILELSYRAGGHGWPWPPARLLLQSGGGK